MRVNSVPGERMPALAHQECTASQWPERQQRLTGVQSISTSYCCLNYADKSHKTIKLKPISIQAVSSHHRNYHAVPSVHYTYNYWSESNQIDKADPNEE